MKSDKKIRKPKQARSIQMKEKILITAINVFCEKGYYNTTTNEIANTAAISIGSLYSYYKNKKEILLEAIEYHSQIIDKNIESIITSDLMSKQNNINELLQSIFNAHKILPNFQKEIAAISLLDSDVKAIVKKLDSQNIERTYRLLKIWESELKVRDLYLASFIVYSIVEDIVHKSLFGQTDIADECLIDELKNIIYNYLF